MCRAVREATEGRRSRSRGTTPERGYGKAHERERRRLAPEVATGRVPCARCGHLIAAGDPWDLDHDDEDRSRYLGPSHRACNRATAGRRRVQPAPARPLTDEDRLVAALVTQRAVTCAHCDEPIVPSQEWRRTDWTFDPPMPFAVAHLVCPPCERTDWKARSWSRRWFG